MGQSPDWDRWVDSPGPFRGHTTGLRWARHGRSARAMTRGLEMSVPDGTGARSLAGFGWGLPMESIPGLTGDGKFDGETFFGRVVDVFFWGEGDGKRKLQDTYC